MKNEYILIKNVLKLSKSKDWKIAKKEWTPIKVFYEKNNTCLCSHYPITENIILKNINNSNEIIVGNCCINKFFEIKTFNKFFKALHKNKINQIIIDIAYKKNIINNWEKEFMTDI
jgi:hypothetical protein